MLTTYVSPYIDGNDQGLDSVGRVRVARRPRVGLLPFPLFASEDPDAPPPPLPPPSPPDVDPDFQKIR